MLGRRPLFFAHGRPSSIDGIMSEPSHPPTLEQVAEKLALRAPANVSAIGPELAPGWYLVCIDGAPKWVTCMFAEARPEYASAGWNNVLTVGRDGEMQLRYIW